MRPYITWSCVRSYGILFGHSRFWKWLCVRPCIRSCEFMYGLVHVLMNGLVFCSVCDLWPFIWSFVRPCTPSLNFFSWSYPSETQYKLTNPREMNSLSSTPSPPLQGWVKLKMKNRLVRTSLTPWEHSINPLGVNPTQVEKRGLTVIGWYCKASCWSSQDWFLYRQMVCLLPSREFCILIFVLL